jgi:hypothetical protein
MKARVVVLREKRLEVRGGRIRHSNVGVRFIVGEGNQF